MLQALGHWDDIFHYIHITHKVLGMKKARYMNIPSLCDLMRLLTHISSGLPVYHAL